jgi:TolB-like protein/Flp pilus assembly protein TadD
VYAISLQEGVEPPAPEHFHKSRSRWRPVVATLVALAALAALGVAMWLRPWQPDTEASPAGLMENALPGKPSIVVLPFDNMSSDPEQAYFADGITEDITTHLSKIGELFVISRNSAFSYKGKNIRARQIADDLNVRYLLEGSVRRAANQVRINAQLVDGATGSHLWAEIYDGTLENIFAVQDEVTAQIVEALKVRLTDIERKRVYGAETKSPEAYDAFLKGWRRYLSNSSKELPLARDNFERALELDSNYTRAYAALAAVYHKAKTEQWFTLRIDDWAMQRRLNENLERATREPNSLALTVAARIEIRKGQHANAIRHARSAIELEPNSTQAHTVLGKAMLFEGRQDEALKNLEIAIRLDPHNTSEPLGLSGLSRFLLGETDVAVSILEKSLGLHPERSAAGAEVTLTAAYAQLERKDDARNQAETMRQLWKDFHWRKPNIVDIMTHFPFSQAADARQLAENLLLAGVCCEQDLENVLGSKKK